jgi:hypothetical protein
VFGSLPERCLGGEEGRRATVQIRLSDIGRSWAPAGPREPDAQGAAIAAWAAATRAIGTLNGEQLT